MEEADHYQRLMDGATQLTRPSRILNCDEISWLKHVLERFAESCSRQHPSVSRASNAAKMAALLEIMEITGCAFHDDAARHNAISDFPELYQGKRATEPKAAHRNGLMTEPTSQQVQR